MTEQVGTTKNTTALAADAGNRALRTAVQGLGIDVGVAILVVLATAFNDSKEWGSLQWSLIAYSVIKTVIQTVLSYVMRRFATRENILTPPTPQAEPAKPLEPAAPAAFVENGFAEDPSAQPPEPAQQGGQVIDPGDEHVSVFGDQTPAPLNLDDLPDSPDQTPAHDPNAGDPA